MITLREDQIEALSRAAEQRVKRELVASFSKQHPAHPEVERVVDEAFAAAVEYQIPGQDNLVQLTALGFLVDALRDAPLVPAVVARVLGDAATPVNLRLEFLTAQLKPRTTRGKEGW